MNSDNIDFLSRIDALLKRIANVLLVNASFIDTLGLLNGKMGITIFFYHYYKYSGDTIYDDYAGDLLDEIYAQINTNTPVGLADGLAGIGLGIEYLVKNKFVVADIDEALSDIDVAMNLTGNTTPVLINDQDRFFSLLHYYIARLNNLPSSKEKVKAYIKNNKLETIISECERFVLQRQFLKGVASETVINQLNSITWFLLETERMRFFLIKSREILKYIFGNIKKINVYPTKSSEVEFLLELLNRRETCDKRGYEKETLGKYEKVTFDCKVEDFIKHKYWKIIYGDYWRNMELSFSLENLLCQTNEDDYWNKLLDNIKQDYLSLNGISGLGLGLIDINSNSENVNSVHI